MGSADFFGNCKKAPTGHDAKFKMAYCAQFYGRDLFCNAKIPGPMS